MTKEEEPSLSEVRDMLCVNTGALDSKMSANETRKLIRRQPHRGEQILLIIPDENFLYDYLYGESDEAEARTRTSDRINAQPNR